MSKVFVNIGLSLDGYMTPEGMTIENWDREEGLIGEDLTDYAQGIAVLTRWQDYYNHRRPHSALRYLRPVDYYRGDPEARLAERRRKLQHALVARKTYWKDREVQSEAAGG